MDSLRESCYALTALNERSSPLEFSCVFRTQADAARLGMDVFNIKVRNSQGRDRDFYLPENSAYLSGRVYGELMWRLLNECTGNRILHTKFLFGNVYVRGKEFHVSRDQGGFTYVSSSLPTTWQMVDAFMPLCPDLQHFSKEGKMYPVVSTLCRDILNAHRNGDSINPEAYFDELLEE